MPNVKSITLPSKRAILLSVLHVCQSWMAPSLTLQSTMLRSSTSSLYAASSSQNNQEEVTASRIVKASTTESTNMKGRVLMFHGWAQNANAFSMKTKTLTKKLNQAGYDCIFLEGPHLLPIQSTGDRQNARAWFLLNAKDPADDSLSQAGIPVTYIGLETSLEMVRRELLQLPPHLACTDNSASSSSGTDKSTTSVKQNDYDNNDGNGCITAILGFSQGAVFCHILALLAQRQSQQFGAIDAVVLASGFAAQHVPATTTTTQRQRQGFDTGRLPDRLRLDRVPSLHLIGKTDTSVDPRLSLDLTEMFVNGEVLWHQKGHVVPQKSAECSQIIAFLDTCRSKQQQV